MSDSTLKRTALNDWHKAHGARMVSFAGWEMPVQYPTGPLREHLATREGAGLFDIDHMGQIRVFGPDAETYVNRMVTFDVSRMDLLQAHYAILCYADGGVVDDLFVYKLPRSADDSTAEFLLVVNASNLHKDVAWLLSHSHGLDVTVLDVSPETYMLALQGPEAVAILGSSADVDLAAVPRFGATVATLWNRVPTVLGRTGYTGEDGFELFFPGEHALTVWERLLEAGEGKGLLPVGLAARDSLRFEPCMPLYGQEIDAFHTPIEARLSFALRLAKDFIGRDALLKQKLEGAGERLCGLELSDPGVPRHGHAVLHQGLDVGYITSGMFSPTTKRYLGMAFLPAELSAVDTPLEIVIHERPRAAKVVAMPFYVPAYRR